jgi:hypothetical protein
MSENATELSQEGLDSLGRRVARLIQGLCPADQIAVLCARLADVCDSDLNSYRPVAVAKVFLDGFLTDLQCAGDMERHKGSTLVYKATYLAEDGKTVEAEASA